VSGAYEDPNTLAEFMGMDVTDVEADPATARRAPSRFALVSAEPLIALQQTIQQEIERGGCVYYKDVHEKFNSVYDALKRSVDAELLNKLELSIRSSPFVSI